MRTLAAGLLVVLVEACNGAPAASPPPRAVPPAAPAPIASASVAPTARSAPVEAAPPTLVATSVALPGATGPVTTDLIAYDPVRDRVWVPVGETGSVDVFEIASGSFDHVDGFKTAQREMHGKKRTMGPSSVTVGDGVAYVGNRGASEVCAIDETKLERGTCLALPTPADFVTYVGPTKEVWATTPKDQSITLLDARKPGALRSKTVIKTPGSPEGAAVDASHGVYYTNLEDTNQTLAIDLVSHAIKATWSSGCGGAPHGVATDASHEIVFVACSDGVRILDGAHEGAVLGKLDTGEGVDDVFYDPSKQLLYVAAAKVHRLTVARIGEHGEVHVVATGTTGEHARNAVADARGQAYVVDAASGRLVLLAPPP